MALSTYKTINNTDWVKIEAPCFIRIMSDLKGHQNRTLQYVEEVGSEPQTPPSQNINRNATGRYSKNESNQPLIVDIDCWIRALSDSNLEIVIWS